MAINQKLNKEDSKKKKEEIVQDLKNIQVNDINHNESISIEHSIEKLE